MSAVTPRQNHTRVRADDSLGERIRRVRKSQGKTLQDLASAAGISTSFLSQIEREQAKPSVGTLHTIAEALGLTIADLFVAPAAGVKRTLVEPLAHVVRKDGRKALVYPGSGIRNELLVPDLKRGLQMMWIVIPPGEGTGDEPLVHEGEECGVVLAGEVEIWVGEGEAEERYVLSAGDSIWQLSTIPHRSRNIGDVDAIIVTAITPPSF